MNKLSSESKLDFISLYLKKIGVKQSKSPSLEYLSELVHKNMITFGWDTLDLYLNKKIFLEPHTIMNKFFNESRGGICYELSIAFNYLLNQLGFHSHLSSSHLYGYNDKSFNFEIDTHVVIIVVLGQEKYLVDLSWDFLIPVLICEEKYFNDRSNQYRLFYDQNNKNYVLEKFFSNLWRKQYDFTLQEYPASSFYENLEIVIKGKEYSTYKQIKIIKFTEKGAIAILNDTFVVVDEHDRVNYHPISNIAETCSIMAKEFLLSPSFIEFFKTHA